MPKTLRELSTAKIRKLKKEYPQLLSEIDQQLRQTIEKMLEEDRRKSLKKPANVQALKRATSKLRPALLFLFVLDNLIQSEEVVDIEIEFNSGKKINILVDRVRQEIRAGRYRTLFNFDLLVKDDQDQVLWGSNNVPKERLDNLLFNVLLRESPTRILIQGPRTYFQWDSMDEMIGSFLERQQQRQRLVERMTRKFRHIKKEDLRQNLDLRRIIRFLLTRE